MEIMGKEFYFTFGPIFTVIVAPIIVILVQRLIKKTDQAAEDRHCTLIKAIAKVEKTFTEKLEDHCQKQEKLHKQIDERFWKHSHTLDENGQVTKDIIIKGGM